LWLGFGWRSSIRERGQVTKPSRVKLTNRAGLGSDRSRVRPGRHRDKEEGRSRESG
jgi:hypothetical protein